MPSLCQLFSTVTLRRGLSIAFASTRVRPRGDRQWYHQDDGINRPRPQGHLLSFHFSAPVGQGSGPLTIKSNSVHTGDLSSDGTMKGNIEVTNTGDFVMVSKGNKETSAQGQGVKI